MRSTQTNRKASTVQRVVLIVSGSLVVIAALLWPLFEVVRGPVLWDFRDHHGIDAGDLIAVPLLLLGVLLLRTARVLHPRATAMDASSK